MRWKKITDKLFAQTERINDECANPPVDCIYALYVSVCVFFQSFLLVFLFFIVFYLLKDNANMLQLRLISTSFCIMVGASNKFAWKLIITLNLSLNNEFKFNSVKFPHRKFAYFFRSKNEKKNKWDGVAIILLYFKLDGVAIIKHAIDTLWIYSRYMTKSCDWGNKMNVHRYI